MSVQAGGGEDPLPEVVGLETLGIGRVAGPVAPALVERQEPRRLAREVRAHPHLVLVHREVHHAPTELEQLLPRVPVAPVLLDGVVHRLFGEAVLQLEGSHRQAVDEETQVERALRLVAAVAELPGDAEAIPGVPLGGRRVARRGRPVEQVEVMRTVLQAVAQHVHHAALRDLSLEPREELAPRRTVLIQVEGFRGFRLRRQQEPAELRQVHAVLAVVVTGGAADPAGDPVERRGLLHAARAARTGVARGPC